MNELKLIIILLLFLFIIYLIYLGLSNRLNFSFLNLEISKKMKDYFNLGLDKNRFEYIPSYKAAYLQSTSSNINLLQNQKKEERLKQDKLNEKQEEQKIEKQIPLGFQEKDLSPYYQKISFSFYRSWSKEYFENIIINNNSEEEIDITGWYFKTNKGPLFTIPKGIEDYNLNSFLNYQDIILKPKDKAVIYRGFNLTNIRYFNFRLNKCTGYLNNIYKFQPPLPRECPGLEIKDLVLLSGECQNFLRSLKNCYQPSAFEINKFANEYECRKYFDELNYGACYKKYRKKEDFFKNEWRIYLKPDVEVFDFNLDKLHDRVMLFDKNNLLVNLITY